MDIPKIGLNRPDLDQKNITALVQEKPLDLNGTTDFNVSQGGKNGY